MKLNPAEIDWSSDGLPYSKGYGDLYFSKEDGLSETRYTFLAGNQIEERFAQLEPNAQFTILETGFGTGLNFLATLEAWDRLAATNAKLNFISIEAHPLNSKDLSRAHNLWPELSQFSSPLLQGYPHLTPGFHLVNISPSVSLLLIFAEVKEALNQLAGPTHPKMIEHLPSHVDAFYLDGFAPRVNPEMWDENLFPQIAALGRDKSTAATFTSAGAVKRRLKDAGFTVAKVPGYGRKREMITAQLQSEDRNRNLIKPDRRRPLATWSLSTPAKSPDSVTILGAGIAGLSLADNLSRRGVSVTLIDACTKAVQKASGNSQAALFARLSPNQGDLEDFALTALEYATRYYRESRFTGAFHPSGLVQLPRKTSELNTMMRVAERLDAARSLIQFQSDEQLSRLANIQLDSAGLWMPASGWVDPATLAKRILSNPSIKTQFNTEVARIKFAEGSWQLLNKTGDSLHQTNCLVVAAGNHSRQLPELDWLPTRSIRGQVSHISRPQLQSLRAVVCAHGYLAPALNGLHSLGATYDLDNDSTENSAADNLQNLEVLKKLTGFTDAEVHRERSGVRCATPDYIPLCGPAPDIEKTQSIFAPLGKDAKNHILSSGQNLDGLYLNLGYGSRGFCYAPLCAEHLASQILGTPSPLPHYLSAALHPSRFIIRNIIRNKR